ncbi:hypothetical protein GF362_03120 [Candidatus Dojkabacteria bacterium]|nr:hypothetical protein [Candidatus Dojkabacteria bacterium]
MEQELELKNYIPIILLLTPLLSGCMDVQPEPDYDEDGLSTALENNNFMNPTGLTTQDYLTQHFDGNIDLTPSETGFQNLELIEIIENDPEFFEFAPEVHIYELPNGQTIRLWDKNDADSPVSIYTLEFYDSIDGIEEIVEGLNPEPFDDAIILEPPNPNYNCHSHSFGYWFPFYKKLWLESGTIFDGEDHHNSLSTLIDNYFSRKDIIITPVTLEGNLTIDELNERAYADHLEEGDIISFEGMAYYHSARVVENMEGELVFETKLGEGELYQFPTLGKLMDIYAWTWSDYVFINVYEYDPE